MFLHCYFQFLIFSVLKIYQPSMLFLTPRISITKFSWIKLTFNVPRSAIFFISFAPHKAPLGTYTACLYSATADSRHLFVSSFAKHVGDPINKSQNWRNCVPYFLQMLGWETSTTKSGFLKKEVIKYYTRNNVISGENFSTWYGKFKDQIYLEAKSLRFSRIRCCPSRMPFILSEVLFHTKASSIPWSLLQISLTRYWPALARSSD